LNSTVADATEYWGVTPIRALKGPAKFIGPLRGQPLKLGYNLVILPKEQNIADWHSEDYSVTCMPESYADRLAASDIVSIRHILPSLQQKINWLERRTLNREPFLFPIRIFCR
jgi:hypothetical protein